MADSFCYFIIATCLSGIVCRIRNVCFSLEISTAICVDLCQLFLQRWIIMTTLQKIILTFFLSLCWFKCTGFRLHAFSKWFYAVTIDITQLPILVQRWEGLLWEAKWLHRQSSKLMYLHIPLSMLVTWN